MKNLWKKVGTSFEDKSETTLTGRGLMPWEQKVADERTGKRKFHGAFTGGFAAGYKNTCGSETGFTPSTFVSSRVARASIKQDISDYMDSEDIDQISLSKNLLTKNEKVGEKLLQTASFLDEEDDEGYGPTMPPKVDAISKNDFFGLGYVGSSRSAEKVVKNKAGLKSLFKTKNAVYDDMEEEERVFEDFVVDEEVGEKVVSATVVSIELVGFVLGTIIIEQQKFSPPHLPPNYNPATYLMRMSSHNHHRGHKFERSEKKVELESAAPLLSNYDQKHKMLIKTFVKSSDAVEKQKLISKEILPYTNDPAKNVRCHNFFCLQEGLEIGGIAEAHLMTASQMRKEKEEFMKVYQEWKKNSGNTTDHVTISHVQKSTDRKVEPWRPSKLLCLGFNLPQPQINIIESKPVNNFTERVLPVIKSSNVTQSRDKNTDEILHNVFGDLCEVFDYTSELPFKKPKTLNE